MASIRVKFEDGVFIPLDDVSDVQPGQRHTIEIVDPEAQAADLAELRAYLAEVRATIPPLPEPTPEDYEALKVSAAESAGIYADDPVDAEALLQAIKEQDIELQRKRLQWLSSL